MKRSLGVDYGLARIGLAISDPTGTIALPFTTLVCSRKVEGTIQAFMDLIVPYQPLKQIVLGMPLLLNGKRGHMADEVHHFAKLLAEKFSLDGIEAPIQLWDERLTSLQADKALREGGLRRKKRAQHVDCAAAVILLQSYLDVIH